MKIDAWNIKNEAKETKNTHKSARFARKLPILEQFGGLESTPKRKAVGSTPARNAIYAPLKRSFIFYPAGALRFAQVLRTRTRFRGWQQAKPKKRLHFFGVRRGQQAKVWPSGQELRSDSRQATLAKMTTSNRAKSQRPFTRRAQMTQNNDKMREHLKRSGLGTKRSLFCRRSALRKRACAAYAIPSLRSLRTNFQF